MQKVYIASPYTIGDVAVNVATQIKCANDLMDLGFAPYVPLLNHFQHMFCPRPNEDWLKLDMEWVHVCDHLLRLPGPSVGADKEVQLALLYNIPVHYSIGELISQAVS